MLPRDVNPLHPWTRRLFWLNLIVEVGIVITGGLVRLTGSGLGCPDWPQCVPGSLTPVRHQEQSWHKYIEFGNRTLTGLVSVVAVALIIAVIVEQRVFQRRKRLVPPLLGVLAGIALQAIVGGITVHLKLNPWIVATHFMGSMVLVWASAWLVWRSREGDGPVTPTVRVEVRWVAYAVGALTAVVLFLGTMVTGAGPHSGDANAPARLSVSPQSMAWLHADVVMLYCGLAIAVTLAVRLVGTSRVSFRAWLAVLVVIGVQGVIGYTQYFLAVPPALVLLHMLGACLLVVAVTWAVLSLRERATA